MSSVSIPVPFADNHVRETTEAFLDGHVSAFAFLGGVPRSILYDNTTLEVARLLGDGTRRRTQAFTHLQSHYLFRDRFGRPGKSNDKREVGYGAAPVHGADPEGARTGRFERAAAGALPGAARRAEARGRIFRPFVEWALGGGQFQAADLTGLRDCPSSKRLRLM